ncbi:multiple epidermal growth factor-like domains protein 10 [Crassostrea angulata]|uniref:multiple epidermal growth factor-like domains protein 10 n=1 Tax=Magallana angulata TaxID=2784310 RepID=UPI0022B1C4E8|nr:multiple epidermal growth factor-like domains protein 10 [Crassostrea angulata]
MVKLLWIFLIHYLNISMIVCQNIGGSNVCMVINSPYVRCCTGFYLSQDKCIECEPGTTGENCSIPCAPGYFGRQCNERCHCPPGKFCDPMKGCLCNSTSVKCTDPEPAMTETVTKATVPQSNYCEQYYKFLLFSISVITLLFMAMLSVR